MSSRTNVLFGMTTWMTVGLAGVVVPDIAQADVMQVDPTGYQWVAGAPAGAPPSPWAAQADFASEPGGGVLSVAPGSVTIAPDAVGPARWQARIRELAVKYDISPSLLEAVVWQESRWNEAAVSPVGARGLTQLMPGTARQMGVDPGDPQANLEGGARYLRLQLDRFGGDIEKALAAYNAGPGRVQQARGVPDIAETRAYVAAIMGRLAAPVRQ